MEFDHDIEIEFDIKFDYDIDLILSVILKLNMILNLKIENSSTLSFNCLPWHWLQHVLQQLQHIQHYDWYSTAEGIQLC